MNSILANKIRYALYSPFVWILLEFKRVKTKGRSFFGGYPFIDNIGEMTIGRNCRFMSLSTGNPIGINHKCMLTTYNKNAKLTIGNYCGFFVTSILCFERITLGNCVRVGANCLIMDGDAHQDDPRAGKNKPILIEDNVWLGGNVVVLKGVTIGRNSLIGMNSVVTKDIPANVIAAGNPCRVIRSLTNERVLELEQLAKL